MSRSSAFDLRARGLAHRFYNKYKESSLNESPGPGSPASPPCPISQPSGPGPGAARHGGGDAGEDSGVWDTGQALFPDPSGVLGHAGLFLASGRASGPPGASPAAPPFAARGYRAVGKKRSCELPSSSFLSSAAGGHLSRLCISLIRQSPSQSIRAPFPGREDTSSQTLPPSQTRPAGLFLARPHPRSSQGEPGASSEPRLSLVQAWQPDVEQGEPGKSFDLKIRG